MKDQHSLRVAKLYDELSQHGPYGTLAPSNKGGMKSRYVAEVFDAALLPVLQHHARADDVLLDYGCGTGIFTVQAAPYVGQAIGIDISEAMIDVARQLPAENITWLVGDGESVDLPDSSVHWIVARESLCYVPREKLPSMLSELYRILAPDGRFLWLEQISDNPRFQTQPAAPMLEKRSAHHLQNVAGEAGFTVDEAFCVRQPRFPWIYPIWAGLVPLRMMSRLARLEVRFNRRFSSLRAGRWKDALIILRKSP